MPSFSPVGRVVDAVPQRHLAERERVDPLETGEVVAILGRVGAALVEGVDAAATAKEVLGLAGFDWLVLEDDTGKLLGYAYYGKFRERKAYDGTVETSIYLDASTTGKGYGKVLYAALIEAIRARGFREVIGCLALPNDASITLHEKMGFAKVGHFPGTGYKFGRYVDVGFWQLSLQK